MKVYTDAAVSNQQVKELRKARGVFTVVPEIWDFESGEPIFEQFTSKVFKYGNLTSNKAEYFAILSALKWIEENVPKIVENLITKEMSVAILSDSQLVVSQINGLYKNNRFQNEYNEVKEIQKRLEEKGVTVVFVQIPREHNLAGKIFEEVST